MLADYALAVSEAAEPVTYCKRTLTLMLSLTLGPTLTLTLPSPPQVGETYDWRLSVANMERRDSYFSRLKARIELLHSTQGEKARQYEQQRQLQGWKSR